MSINGIDDQRFERIIKLNEDIESIAHGERVSIVKPLGSAAPCATLYFSALLSYTPSIRVAVALFSDNRKCSFSNGDGA